MLTEKEERLIERISHLYQDVMQSKTSGGSNIKQMYAVEIAEVEKESKDLPGCIVLVEAVKSMIEGDVSKYKLTPAYLCMKSAMIFTKERFKESRITYMRYVRTCKHGKQHDALPEWMFNEAYEEIFGEAPKKEEISKELMDDIVPKLRSMLKLAKELKDSELKGLSWKHFKKAKKKLKHYPLSEECEALMAELKQILKPQ